MIYKYFKMYNCQSKEVTDKNHTVHPKFYNSS